MSNYATLTITTDKTSGDLSDKLIHTNPQLAVNSMRNYLKGIVSGSDSATVSVKVNTGNAVAASGTLTCSSVAATDTAVVLGTTFTAVDKREKTQLTAVADTAGSLNNTYVVFYSASNATKYYMWYNVNSLGVDPAVAGATAIPVALATGATANTVASASRTALALKSDFTTSGATDKIIFQNVSAGTTTDTADTGSTGFTVTKVIDGGTVSAVQFQIGTDTVSGANLAAAINATAALAAVVTAVNASGVVTVTANTKGTAQNFYAISATSGVTAGAALLAGGVNDTTATTNTYSF